MFSKTRLCSRLMLAFGGTLLIGGAPAVAQEAQRIEITGSAIRRIDAESAAPSRASAPPTSRTSPSACSMSCWASRP